MLQKVRPAIEYLHANTAEMPIYWEQLEAEQGHFDFTVLDTLLTQAREHPVHLALPWFRTWKNASSHYMPVWMKSSPERHPRMTGVDGHPLRSPSPYANATI